MITPSNTRGVALLITLAVIVVTLSALGALARTASTARATRTAEAALLVADDLLFAVEPAIHRWLEQQSQRVALPPTTTVPGLAILSSRWDLPVARDHSGEPIPIEVSVSAFDQLGMVPWSAVISGSRLRATLPTEILRVITACARGADRSPGLDILQDGPRTVAVFPNPIDSDPSPGQNRIALGSLVATHNPVPSSPGALPSAPPRINVSTAPIPLVESALRLHGLGGLEQIIQARNQGRRPAIAPGAGGRSDPSIPELTNSSNAWSFRIDVHIGSIRKSWWSVYVRLSRWECLQRFVIDE
jgi:hypothetical protein